MVGDTELTGTIINIQRFSIHDGPGIRTTVFFKGCSLHCFWCHNPESIRPRPEIQFYADRCIGCGACMETCPQGLHVVGEEGHTYDRSGCRVCGRCVDVCYAGALELTGRTVTVDQVMAEIREDRSFYTNSGGGITLSGGEPVLQRDFAAALLGRCQTGGLHTAIETAANCHWEDLAALLPVTDLVMMDIKHMDPAKHKAATGVSNQRILANAQRLVRTGIPVLFRIPVIPGVNDDPQDIAAIAGFVRSLLGSSNGHSARSDNLPHLELLPFHRLAADKYRSLALDYRASQLAAPSREQMTELAAVAGTYDLSVRSR